MTVRILQGDCREILKVLPDQSVHCCVTSPPYFGLRDYGCNGQMGLEETPEEFISGMVGVFREVRRVLRDDGTLWLNIGDSYAGSGRGGYAGGKSTLDGTTDGQENSRVARGSELTAGFHATAQLVGAIGREWVPPPAGLKQKDLIGIPWMLAFALRADGWYLRQEIIWAKPNPMPESVTDRCTKSHESLFLLAKFHRYYFDAAAIKEPATGGLAGNNKPTKGGRAYYEGATEHRTAGGLHKYAEKQRSKRDSFKRNDSKRVEVMPGQSAGTHRPDRDESAYPLDTRNKRSVWTVATQPFKEAHFATFPPALIEPCILAGSPGGGVIVDPFAGAGTTGLVSDRCGRDSILIELNQKYAEMARRRIFNDSPLFSEVIA